MVKTWLLASSLGFLLAFDAAADATETACEAGACAEAEDEATSALMQLRSADRQPSVDCATIDTTSPFCCWYPQPIDCDTCQKCTVGWTQCPNAGSANRCPGSGGGPNPGKTCSGPNWNSDWESNNNIQPYGSSAGGTTDTADLCKNRCSSNPNCVAYTWKTDGSKQCWLKDWVQNPVSSGSSASGSCEDASPRTCSGPEAKLDWQSNNNIQPYGSSAGGTTDTADLCKARCSSTPDCKAYTWKTDSKQCWLKDWVSGEKEDSLSVSGYCSP